MKECELPHEIMAILTLASGETKARSALASILRESHFADPRTKHAFNVIMALARRRKEMPTWQVLQEAPQLSQEAKDLINEDTYKPAKSEGDAEQILEVLDKLRKGRIVDRTYKDVMEKLLPEDADIDAAFSIMEKGLMEARDFEDEETLVAGSDGNLMEAVAEVLSREKPNTIPTGFRDFDEEAGGLPKGGLTTLAASSGGGKSCMAQQICINAYNAGYSAAIVTLEMQKEQTVNRLCANIANVNHKDITLARLNDMQKQKIARAMEKFNVKGEKEGKRLAVYHMHNTTISEIAVALKPFNYDIIVVDYINLLNKEDVDAKGDAEALGSISKIAKLQAGTTNSAWIVLAQLNEQGLVKYSRAIAENSDYLLSWTYGDAERESHIIEISQQKSRNSEAFKFNLRECFKTQSFENCGNAERNADMNVRKSKKKPAKRHPTAKPMPGLDFEEEDEDDL